MHAPGEVQLSPILTFRIWQTMPFQKYGKMFASLVLANFQIAYAGAGISQKEVKVDREQQHVKDKDFA